MTDDPQRTPQQPPSSPTLTEARMRELLDRIRTTPESRRRALEDAKDAVRELRSHGKTLKQISDLTGVPWQTIRNWAEAPEV